MTKINVLLKPRHSSADLYTHAYDQFHTTASNVDVLDRAIVVTVDASRFGDWFNRFNQSFDDGSGACQSYDFVSAQAA